MIPKNNCPKCNAILYDSNPIYQPVPGNYCICIYCGNAAIFDKNLKLKKAKKIPLDILIQSIAAKEAIIRGVSLDQMIKTELLKRGHIKEH